MSDQSPAPQPATGGLHLGEWAAELLGTAVLVFAALSAVTLMFHPRSAVQDWIPSESARLLILGIVFAVIIIAIATSPTGRLSRGTYALEFVWNQTRPVPIPRKL